MAIKNYTTTIDSEKTIAEINKCLVEHGVEKIMLDYEDKMPIALVFRCTNTGNPDLGIEMDFRLPCRWRATRKILDQSSIANKFKTDEQAIRTSWRIIHDWVHAQMALVEMEMVDIGEVFLPYATLKSGKTIYESIKAGENFKLLEK